MEKETNINGMKRRKFLQKTSAFAATAMFLPIDGLELIGFNDPIHQTSSIPTVTLNNGVEMPMIGFGTNTLRGAIGVQAVSEACSVGYRLIDTAHIYGNEESVGVGINKSGVNRKELFITSKLWVNDSGYESTKRAFQTSIDKLGMDYLDLYLIHRPRGDVKGTWLAMEELYKEGKIKAIGLSNFEPEQIDDLMTYATVTPAVNQIETHVFYQQDKAHEYLKKNNIQMEAWSPFAAGRNDIFNNQLLADIGKKYNKTNAQICLRWIFQRGIVAIPRSKQKAHMIENLNIFDFELSKSDMKAISNLDLNTTQFPEWG